MAVHGWCHPRFSRVREVFRQNFAGDGELGAAFSVFLDDKPVVDLWGGVADRRDERPWERGTPALVYSCTKAVTATAVLLLAERGLLDVTAPVAEVWPEFARAGKERITVEHLLTHQAGLPVVEEPVPVEEFEDQEAVADRLAGQTPLWEPGTAHGYHALTYGFLLGEVIRRVSGKRAGEFVAAEIADPLGLELWLGAPDDVAARAARLSGGLRVGASAPAPEDALGAAMLDGESLTRRALGNPQVTKLPGGANHPVILRAGWPAIGVVATALGLAGFYRHLVAGRILRPETLADAVRARVSGPDRVLLVDSSFGLGYMRPARAFPVPGQGSLTAFGHTGLGGFLGLGDVEHGLGMAYTMNRMTDAIADSPRALRLAEAVYASLDASP
ncbi:serine hydrolase domain-containing protein [Streptosporangium saharense]|uniref:CubicO group peptidase (Beta-lactamase class C family) n=1 Tax=Streptosporangium saharense TaxID=1706840 RepID=A0A7W7QS24_9ACTN|nr:serine hydrolase domain-containing protein [Streptosporangium saharense]MBB4918131.1 CubicO group peptidase (beta-lactamase class C family) [Streptosporangium saharense]